MSKTLVKILLARMPSAQFKGTALKCHQRKNEFHRNFRGNDEKFYVWIHGD